MALLPVTEIVLRQFGEQAVKQMKANASKYKATGTMERSFRYELRDDGMAILGVDYVTWFEQGRGRTKNTASSTPTLKDAILTWLKAKPVPQWRDAQGKFISRQTQAFLIARRIHKMGVSWHNQTPRTIYSNVLTKESITKLRKDLTKKQGISVTSDIMRVLNNLQQE